MENSTMHTLNIPSAVLAAGLTCAIAAQLAAQEPVVTPLATTPLPDVPGKEVQLLTVEYAPGVSEPIHRHDANTFVYVLEGSVVMQVKGAKPVTLTPGQTFYEGREDEHLVGRNPSSTKPARFVVFQLKDRGAPAVVGTACGQDRFKCREH
jgi:quercetin dioxygenase-like cupin family protein